MILFCCCSITLTPRLQFTNHTSNYTSCSLGFLGVYLTMQFNKHLNRAFCFSSFLWSLLFTEVLCIDHFRKQTVSSTLARNCAYISPRCIQCPWPCGRPLLPCLCWRLPDAHRKFWLNLLWGHFSFLLDPCVLKVLLCPPRVCFSSPVKVL